MDPFSQAALGAAVGHACFHRQLGMRAVVWGAAAGALPDIDILAGLGADPFDQLLHHRGITHSLFFAPVIGPVLGWLLWRVYQRKAISHGGTDPPTSLGAWMGLITVALWSHPLLDYTTPYGTQLLLPFSNARFAIPVMPIIDPLYTAALLTGLVGAWLLRKHTIARWASIAGVVVSTGYIGYSAHLNDKARQLAHDDLASQGIDAEVTAYPTILQVHYRRVVARTDDRDYVGAVSVLEPCGFNWGSAPRLSNPLFAEVMATRQGAIFDWFAMGMIHFSAQANGDSTEVVMSDLRYGAENDPTVSIFQTLTLFGPSGLQSGPHLAQFRPSPSDPRITQLLSRVYTPCRVLGAGRSSAPSP